MEATEGNSAGCATTPARDAVTLPTEASESAVKTDAGADSATGQESLDAGPAGQDGAMKLSKNKLKKLKKQELWDAKKKIIMYISGALLFKTLANLPHAMQPSRTPLSRLSLRSENRKEVKKAQRARKRARIEAGLEERGMHQAQPPHGNHALGALSPTGPLRKRNFAHDHKEPSNATIVIDLDFDQYMNDKVRRRRARAHPQDIKKLLKQVQNSYAANRRALHPVKVRTRLMPHLCLVYALFMYVSLLSKCALFMSAYTMYAI